MVNGESIQNATPEADSDLAKDVANLYSWANVEDATYRDFSRQRIRHIRHANDVDIRKSEPALPGGSIEHTARAFEAAAEPSPVPVNPPPAVVDPAVETPPSPAVAAPEVETPHMAPHATPSAPEVETPVKAEARPATFAAGFFEAALPVPVEGYSTAVAIYSLAGGVGKTTFCANLGRILAAMKEKVLLVDASGSGLLPFYFGATDLKCGLRTFVSPDSNYPPLQVIGTDEITGQWLETDVKAAMQRVQRTIFDLGPASMSLLPEIVAMCGMVLIPLQPDLNSILTVQRIEKSFKTMRASGMRVPEVFYIFNRFSNEDSIDQRARLLVEKQCGDRLLTLAIREDEEIARAIASRMTVADQAPGSAVTHDFLELASWVRKQAPIRAPARVQARWSER